MPVSEPSYETLSRALLRRAGYFPWGKDAWIHEDDLGTVLTTREAIAQVAS